MKKAFLSLFLISFLILNISSQTGPTFNWGKNYGGSENELAIDVEETSEGGYIIAGNTYSNDSNVSGNHGFSDMWIAKTSNVGALQWQKCLGGSDYDEAWSIKATSNGGYIIAGHTHSNDGDVSGNHGSVDCWIVKIDNFGDIEWQNCLGGSAADSAKCIVETSDGGYIIAGATNSNDGDVSGNHGYGDYWVVKLDVSGSIEWQKCFGGSQHDRASSIIQTSEGGYIVVGESYSEDGDVSGNHGHSDFWVVKLSISGSIEWQKCFGGDWREESPSIKQTLDGGYVIAGYTNSNNDDVSGNHGSDDVWVVKIDNIGTLVWQNCLGGSNIDRGYDIEQTTDGDYIVSGCTRSSSGDVTGHIGDFDYWMVKLNISGEIDWQQCIGGTDSDKSYGMLKNSLGEYILVGESASDDVNVPGNYGGSDFYMAVVCIASPLPLSIVISNPDYCYSTELIASPGFDSYLWNTGDTTSTITITQGGEYTVSAIDSSGCSSEASIDAPEPLEPYEDQEICIITLDTILDKNKIVIEPTPDAGIDSIQIYRLSNETSQFEIIGTIGVDQSTVFVDNTSNPNQFSQEYKIAVIDTCGHQSSLSDNTHKTILLQENVGVNGEVNLSWNPYEGFYYPNFEIHRSVQSSNFVLIATVPNSTYAYNDLTPPPGDLNYLVRVVKEEPCNATKTEYSNSSSNIVDANPAQGVSAGSDAIICQDDTYTVFDAWASDYTSLLWTSSGSGVLMNATSLTPTYVPSSDDIAFGGVVLTLTVTLSGGGTEEDNMNLTIISNSSVYAGPDTTIIEGENYTVVYASAAHVSSLLWTSSGTGTFNNNTILAPTYTPSGEDITSGIVTLTLTGQSVAPCSFIAADDMLLSISESVKIREHKLHNFRLYPNPASERITLEWDDINVGTINVVDTKGCFVRNRSIEPGARRIDLNTSDLVPGLYTLLIDRKHTLRFVKE